jgi:hypothetical protein
VLSGFYFNNVLEMRVENTNATQTIRVEIKQMGTPFGTTIELPVDSTVRDAKIKAGISSDADVRYNGDIAPDNAILDDGDTLVVQASKYTQG